MTLREWLSLPEVQRQGWTIQLLADRLCRNRVSISRMVNGHTVPRPGEVLKICKITRGAVQPNDWYPEAMREVRAIQARSQRSVRDREARAAVRQSANSARLPA